MTVALAQASIERASLVTEEALADRGVLLNAVEIVYVSETATGLAFAPDTPLEVWAPLVVRLIVAHKRIEFAPDQEWGCGKIVGRKSPRLFAADRGRHRGVGSMPRQYTPRVAVQCDICQRVVMRSPSKAEGARFCGRACFYKWRRRQDTPSLFWVKVDKTPSCWLWTGATAHGYGKFRLKGRLQPAHRVAYEWIVGPIPEGMHLDHLCRVTKCVRPDHLEPVTLQENLLRGVGPSAINAKKKTCKYGHPLSGDNLHEWRGNRGCRTCRKASSDAHHARQKAARATR